MTRKLLVIDDEDGCCRLIQAIFKRESVDVIAAPDGASGLARLAAEQPDLVLLDLHLPDVSGMELLDKIRTANPALPVVMLTADRDLKMVVRATRLGAFDYLTKPIDPEEVVMVVRRALEASALQVEVEDLRRQLGEGGSLTSQMGQSAQIREVCDQVQSVASSSLTVLVVGETGTGKELVSEAIHRQSDRRQKPFVALDCGAIPEQLLESELFGHEKGAFTGAERRKTGRFQLAEGGTFFLDEVGNLPMGLQAKLLRVLESKQVQLVGGKSPAPMDVRFIAATNQDLRTRVAEGRFRADLYFRLAQYTISLPALRERPSDVAQLVQRFLQEASVELRRPVREIVPGALDLLEKNSWPGNVRELRNVIRQAVLKAQGFVISAEIIRGLLGKTTTDEPPPSSTSTARSLKEIAKEAACAAERRAISEVLASTHGNKSQAARALRTDYKTLHIKMRLLDLRSRDFES